MDNKTNRVSILAAFFFNTLTAIALFVGIQMLVRIIFVLRYTDSEIFATMSSHIPYAVWNALRFDAQTATYAALPLVLVAIVATISKNTLHTLSFARIFTAIIASLFVVIGLSDIVFYSNFGEHFNIVTFDIMDEEPLLIIKGVWNDTPIISMTIGAIAIGFVAYLIYKHLSRPIINCAKWQKWCIVATIILVPIAIRGNLSTFPLRAEDIYVSPSTKLNDCVPNATFMMKKAWSEKKKQFKIYTTQQLLEQYSFSSLDEAKATWLGISTDSASQLSVEQTLYSTTPAQPKAQGMNVVIILTESWGNRLIDYEQKYGMNLLGEMRKHISSDICFRHFLSATNGTIDAVEHLTISAAYPHMFTSSYRHIDYPTASARLFQQHGYETSFISGIELSWRNLIDVLPHQGFDHVVGKYELLDSIPNAQCNATWGIFDHEVLQFVNKQLNLKSDKPQFVVCLTSTSHTPFDFPEGYPFGHFELNENTADAFTTDNATTTEYLHGYQYESNELGLFMTRLKASSAAQNTIVAITGDHNIRLILPYQESDMWWKYSVPLYMYTPKQLNISADTLRYGSHSDIVPTLASLTLPSATYFKAGQDLLADSLTNTIGINTEYVISDMPQADAKRKADALSVLKKIYFSTLFAKHSSAN